MENFDSNSIEAGKKVKKEFHEIMAYERTLYTCWYCDLPSKPNLTPPSVTPKLLRILRELSCSCGRCAHWGFTFVKRQETRCVSREPRTTRKTRKNHNFVPLWDDNWLRCGLRPLARSTVARRLETTALCARKSFHLNLEI